MCPGAVELHCLVPHAPSNKYREKLGWIVFAHDAGKFPNLSSAGSR